METLQLGWCPTCLDLVSVANGGVCHRGHSVNPDLDGPPPWLGHADADDSAIASLTSAAPPETGTGASQTGVPAHNGAGAANGDDPGSSLLDLHLSLLDEPTAAASNGHAAEVASTPEPGDVAAQEPNADANDRERRRSPEPDPGDVAAQEPNADANDRERRRSPEPDPGDVAQADDELADLLAAELDTLGQTTTKNTTEVDHDEDLANLLAAELDKPTPATGEEEPMFDPDAQTSRPDWLDEPEVDSPPTETPRTESLDEVLGDVLAHFDQDAEDAPPTQATPDDLVAASEVDLVPNATTDLGDDAMADLAELGLFDLDPTPEPDPQPDRTASADPAAPEAADDTDDNAPQPTDPAPASTSNIPAPTPENTVDLMNFTARGTGVRGRGRRRGRKSS